MFDEIFIFFLIGITIAEAPLATASFTYFSPSALLPGIAKKMSPFFIILESEQIPLYFILSEFIFFRRRLFVIYCSDVLINKLSLGKYLLFVSKIGLILSIINREVLATFHPASL